MGQLNNKLIETADDFAYKQYKRNKASFVREGKVKVRNELRKRKV